MLYKLKDGRFTDDCGFILEGGNKLNAPWEPANRFIYENLRQLNAPPEPVIEPGQIYVPPHLFTDVTPRRTTSMDYFSKAEILKARGWTQKMLETYLGGPDFLLVNPRNHKHPIWCFGVERVIAAEQLPAFLRDKAYKARTKAKVLKTRKKNGHLSKDDIALKRIEEKLRTRDLSKMKFPKRLGQFLKLVDGVQNGFTYRRIALELSDENSDLCIVLDLRGLGVQLVNEGREYPSIWITK